MNIDRINISSQGIDRSQIAQKADLTRTNSTNSTNQTGATGDSDSVAVSSKAAEMNRLANSVNQARTERFNKVQAELEAGTYAVSAKDIAQKLVDANTKQD
ncbi:MAG TPA: flagellar biosynthesis anti-sigma factor FlgM [Terriglobia bacterium]